MLNRLTAGLALAAALFLTAPAQARDLVDGQDFTLQFALGGALPHARRDAYLTGTLEGEAAALPRLAQTLRLPLADRARAYFEPRPQILLGASYELGRIGGAALSLDGIFGAGSNETMQEASALLGMAGLRVVF